MTTRARNTTCPLARIQCFSCRTSQVSDTLVRLTSALFETRTSQSQPHQLLKVAKFNWIATGLCVQSTLWLSIHISMFSVCWCTWSYTACPITSNFDFPFISHCPLFTQVTWVTRSMPHPAMLCKVFLTSLRTCWCSDSLSGPLWVKALYKQQQLNVMVMLSVDQSWMEGKLVVWCVGKLWGRRDVCKLCSMLLNVEFVFEY